MQSYALDTPGRGSPDQEPVAGPTATVLPYQNCLFFALVSYFLLSSFLLFVLLVLVWVCILCLLILLLLIQNIVHLYTQHADVLPFHKKLLPEHMTKAGDQASSDGQKKNIIWSWSSRFQMNDKAKIVPLFDNCIFFIPF